jgi:hypothetical protein
LKPLPAVAFSLVPVLSITQAGATRQVVRLPKRLLSSKRIEALL